MAGADPVDLIEIECFCCGERFDQFGGTCVARIVNSGKIAYTALEYRMGWLALGQERPHRLDGRIEGGQSREFEILQFLSSSAGTVEMVLTGAQGAGTQ